MPIERFKTEELPATVWKDGAGLTREVVCWPPGSGFDDFDWRVSVAKITAAAPFSAFSGVDRQMLLMSGDGLKLRGDGVVDELVTLHQPFSFSGDVSLRCEPVGAPSTVVNIMARRAKGAVTVDVLDGTYELPHAMHGLLMTLQGHYRVGGGILQEGEGVWWADQPEIWRLTPASRDARLLALRWSAAGSLD